MLSDTEVDVALRSQGKLAAKVAMDRCHGGNNADLAMLVDLEEALYRRSRFADAETTAWLRSVLLERQNRISETINVLRKLCKYRDRARIGTSNIGLRAPITGLFPALAVRLTALLFKMHASDAEIFDAIEWGKGRALADTHSEGRLPQAAELACLIAGRRIHYLTFLQDGNAIFAALLTNDGMLTTKLVPLSATEQAAVALEKMKSARGDPSAWQSDVASIMAWLPGPCESGPIRLDDIILISPHGVLHSLPLHALPVADGLPLSPRVAVIRTHGVATAVANLTRKSGRLQRFVALRAPTRKERDNPGHRNGLMQVLTPLRAVLKGEVLDGEAADSNGLWAALQPASLLHVMAHGDYDPSLQFYERSGILLAHDGQLPPHRDPEALQGPHLFSPQRLDERCTQEPTRLRNTHVTLLACVSGYSHANLQGDAVGLEWAFLLGGADSVLSSHWHVSFEAASVFCTFFYHAWLVDRQSRARAWQHAVRTAAKDLQGTSTWASFSLSGLWT